MGVICRKRAEDARKSLAQLTPTERRLLEKLGGHWAATLEPIEELAREIVNPLRLVLDDAARALERPGFSQRGTDSSQCDAAGAANDDEARFETEELV